MSRPRHIRSSLKADIRQRFINDKFIGPDHLGERNNLASTFPVAAASFTCSPVGNGTTSNILEHFGQRTSNKSLYSPYHHRSQLPSNGSSDIPTASHR
jgi:hypothetical protein